LSARLRLFFKMPRQSCGSNPTNFRHFSREQVRLV
jgi:hypothetical protein